MREKIPLKKDRNRWGNKALMLGINVKKKNSEKFLIVYFYLRFSII